jgi:phage tail-like protein
VTQKSRYSISSTEPSIYAPLGGGLQVSNAFMFTVDGVEIGVFREVSGLELQISTQDIPEGGQNGYVHKLPGRITWPNITFKKGLTQADNLFAWINEVSGDGFARNSNALTRKTGAIAVVDHDGSPLRSWNLIDVFPVRWSGPSFSTDNQSPLEESLEITHHGFTATTSGTTSTTR